MYEKVRWGIIATGRIAGLFAQGLSVIPDAELVAVGSRTQEAADAFADQYNIPRRHASYEALAEDDAVDAIYVATPHPFHKDNTLLGLKNGKAVLTEKPFAINAVQAGEMINYAREKRVFLMEAMWSRFIPAMVRARQLVQQGAIGEPRMITVDFGFRAGWNPQSRVLNPELAGGALLDVGVYCISLASSIFGSQPAHIASMGHLGETGVDEQGAVLLGYAGGQIASLTTAVRTTTPMEALISGTDGQIKIHSLFWRATKLTVTVYGKETTEIEMPLTGNGYNYQAIEVARCLRAGETESPVMPLDETLAIMRIMDTVRAQWGLKYPMD